MKKPHHAITHGETVGTKNSAEYEAWRSMKKRCTLTSNPAHKRYIDLGIEVCDRWLNSFENFLADMGRRPSPEHSLDRYPNQEGNYEPGNTRWATWEEQNNNKSDCHYLEFNGERGTIRQWCLKLGMNHSTLSMRLQKGMSVERALTLPVQKQFSNKRFR